MFVVNAPTGKGRFGSMCVTAVDFSLMFCCSNRCQCLDVIQIYPTFSDFLHALLTLAWRPGFERLQRHEGKKRLSWIHLSCILIFLSHQPNKENEEADMAQRL